MQLRQYAWLRNCDGDLSWPPAIPSFLPISHPKTKAPAMALHRRRNGGDVRIL
jgi:hypothetical protein